MKWNIYRRYFSFSSNFLQEKKNTLEQLRKAEQTINALKSEKEIIKSTEKHLQQVLSFQSIVMITDEC